MSAQSSDRAEARADVTVDGVRLKVSVRVDRLPVVLGEPLNAIWTVTSGGSAAFVGLGADRITGRILGLSFRATVPGTEDELADPTPEAGALGGPATVHDLGAGDLTLPVVVDDFLDLGPLSQSQSGTLRLACRWDLQVGLDEFGVLGAAPTPVSLSLELPLAV